MSQFGQGRTGASMKARSLRVAHSVTRSIRYCVRHWRGELALLQTLAVNGVAVAVLTLSAASALGWSVDTIVEPTAVALGLTATWAAIALITLWQVVGLMRAADRQARGGRKRLTLALALGATLLVVTAGVSVFIRSGLPQIVEASQFALGKDPIGDVDLRISADGRVLELEGPIVFGVTDHVREMLATYPRVATVRLTSPGGRVAEARDLRDLLREHGVSTIAAGNCASACVTAFMAGRDRLLSSRGTLGFHRYRSPGHGDSEAEASMAIDRRELKARGVPGWFIDRAYSTPNNEMWRPSVTELTVANIVTGELDAEGNRRPALDIRASIEAQLGSSPLLAAVRFVEPAGYQVLIDELESMLRAGTPLSDVASRARPLIARVVARYLPSASDEAVVQATEVSVEALHTLQSRSTACLDYVRARADAETAALPRELSWRESEALAAIVESGAQREPYLPGGSVDADLRTVYGELQAQFGEEANVLGRLNAPDVEPALACRLVTALYEGALELPAPRNAQLLRQLLLATH